jgi:hypothetical protein
MKWLALVLLLASCGGGDEERCKYNQAGPDSREQPQWLANCRIETGERQ